MAKNKQEFVMPGAEPDEIDLDETKVDLSFMEETEEEKEKREAAEARKAEREAEAAAEKEAEDKKKAEREAEAKKEEEKAAAKKAEAEKTDEEKAEEEKLAAELAAKKDEKKKTPMVPKTRLDEVLAKNRALEEKLEAERAAREARTPAPEKDAKAVDLDALEDQYMDAVMAGEKAKAKELRAQIREEETRRVTAKADENTGKDSAATALMEAAARVQEAFPALKEGHADFNEAAFKEVLELRDAYILQGKDPVSALNKAVKLVVKEYDLDVVIEEDKNEKVVDLDKKREENIKKKIDANGKQPPEVKGESNRPKKELNEVAEMSEEEFNALPESTKCRLRGDFI